MNKTAKHYFYESHKQVYGVMKQFNEIMCSENPLTQKEIRQLIDKRPERYAWMSAWLDKHETE